MTVAEIMEAVKELKVMELSELVKALEEEFGVSATPVAVAGAVAGGDGAAAADAKTDFDVVLVDAGSSKIGVIKAVLNAVCSSPLPAKMFSGGETWGLSFMFLAVLICISKNKEKA